MATNRNRNFTQRNVQRTVKKSQNQPVRSHDGWFDMGGGWMCPTPSKSANCVYQAKSASVGNVKPIVPGGPVPPPPGGGMQKIDLTDRPFDGEPPAPRAVHPYQLRPDRRDPECFVAGTKIIMKNGPDKNIEDVVAGDEVLSYNVHTKQIEPKLVENSITQTHDLKDGDITVKIEFSNGTTTHNTIANPFWSKDKGFVAVDEERCNRVHAWVKESNFGKDTEALELNDTLFSYNEDIGDLEEITVENIEYVMEENIRTYDITVKDNHTFFANGILTHNSDPNAPSPGGPVPGPGPGPGGNTNNKYGCFSGQCYGGQAEGYTTLSACQASCQSGTDICTGASYCYTCTSTIDNGLYPNPHYCTQTHPCGVVGEDTLYPSEQQWGSNASGYSICSLFRSKTNCEAGKLVDYTGNWTGGDSGHSQYSNSEATQILVDSPFNGNTNYYSLPVGVGFEWQQGILPHPPSWWFNMGGGPTGYYTDSYLTDNNGNLINQDTDLFWHTNLAVPYGCVWATWY